MKGLVAAMVGGVVTGVAASQVLSSTVPTGEITTIAGAGAAICGLCYSVGHFHGTDYWREREKEGRY